MSLALASRRAAISPAWVKNPLWRTARAVPSLDQPFADTKSLVDAVTGQSLVTFTRASSGRYVGSDGVLQTAAVNEPRFDHNPTTGESLGLLVEEQRTNSIRNNTMVGAVAGTPGTNPTNWVYVTTQSNGLSQSIVGTGTENGIAYIDYRFFGTTVASPASIAFGFESTASAASGQTWTSSIFLKLVSGTTAGITQFQLGLIENNSGGSFVGGALYNIATPTNANLATQRPSATRTLIAATTAFCSPTLGINVAGSTAIDITLRIGLPQLEQGAFATSVIPTTGATATRSADVASITGTAFSSWYRQDEGTVFVDAASIQNGGRYFMFDDGVINDRWEARYSSYLAVLTSWKAGSADVVVNTSVVPANPTLNVKVAAANKSNDAAIASNGIGNIVGTDNTSSMPSVQSRFWIGSFTGTATYVNGTIRRLTYWPARLPNSTLQALSQ